MPACVIPVELDLRALPAREAEVSIDTDVSLLAAHALGDLPALTAVSARLPDGRILPVQCLTGARGPSVHVTLPPDVAARDGVVLALDVVAGDAASRRDPVRVMFSQDADAVELTLDGAFFARYRYNTADPELPRPYFHPILGPTGVPITQDGEIPGTRQAHFHHTGLVMAHQNFTDGNNWQIGPKHSRMRHLAFDVLQSGPLAGRFVERLEWLNGAGDRVLFRETRTVTLPARPVERRYLDVDTTITCGDRPVTWNATPYHLLAIRVPDALTVARGGVITLSTGQTNPKDGSVADWLDFSGTLNTPCGVAIFNHPDNFRHPTPWLNFENETVGAAPTHSMPHTWQPGESLRFRYRVYFHAGDVRTGRVAEEYMAYVARPQSHIRPPVRLA